MEDVNVAGHIRRHEQALNTRYDPQSYSRRIAEHDSYYFLSFSGFEISAFFIVYDT